MKRCNLLSRCTCFRRPLRSGDKNRRLPDPHKLSKYEAGWDGRVGRGPPGFSCGSASISLQFCPFIGFLSILLNRHYQWIVALLDTSSPHILSCQFLPCLSMHGRELGNILWLIFLAIVEWLTSSDQVGCFLDSRASDHYWMTTLAASSHAKICIWNYS
jgi:hypothetical protein